MSTYTDLLRASTRVLRPGSTARAEEIKRALLSNLDGHRNVIDLETFALATGIDVRVISAVRRGIFHRSLR